MASRVLIVDDHEIVRVGLRLLLASNSKWQVCGEAADGPEALREIANLHPDIVILDLSMPLMNGFEVAREAKRLSPSTKIVFFSIHDVPATARHVGADAFVAKSADVQVLMTTLDRLVQRSQSTSA